MQHFRIKNVWHCCDLEIQWRSLTVVRSLKFNEFNQLYQAKFEIYQNYTVWENRKIKMFAIFEQSVGQPKTDHYTLHMMRVKKYLQFIYLTLLLVFKRSMTSNLSENVDPEQCYYHVKFERFRFKCPRKRRRQLFFSFFEGRKYDNYISWNYKLNRIRPWNFQLQVFDTAVILKYNQSQWNGYEWIKLKKYYHQAKFDIYHI